jgi:hypothetical protein
MYVSAQSRAAQEIVDAHALSVHLPHMTSRSVPGGPSGHEGPEKGKMPSPPVPV